MKVKCEFYLQPIFIFGREFERLDMVENDKRGIVLIAFLCSPSYSGENLAGVYLNGKLILEYEKRAFDLVDFFDTLSVNWDREYNFRDIEVYWQWLDIQDYEANNGFPEDISDYSDLDFRKY